MSHYIVTDLLAGTGARLPGTPLFGTRWQAEAYTDRMYQHGDTRHLFVRAEADTSRHPRPLNHF